MVLAVPETGLFVKDGKLITGNGTATLRMNGSDEIAIYYKKRDAERDAAEAIKMWKEGGGADNTWQFIVIPVLMRHQRVTDETS